MNNALTYSSKIHSLLSSVLYNNSINWNAVSEILYFLFEMCTVYVFIY